MVIPLTGNGDKRSWESIPTVLARMLYCRRLSPTSLTFSPDGKTIAVGQSYDDQIELWDGILQCAGLTHEAHQRPTKCLLFSPDGTAVTTTTMDNTVWAWDAASGAMTWLIAEEALIYREFSAGGRIMESTSPKAGFAVLDAVGRKLLRSISFPDTDTNRVPATLNWPYRRIEACWLWATTISSSGMHFIKLTCIHLKVGVFRSGVWWSRPEAASQQRKETPRFGAQAMANWRNPSIAAHGNPYSPSHQMEKL